MAYLDKLPYNLNLIECLGTGSKILAIYELNHLANLVI